MFPGGRNRPAGFPDARGERSAPLPRHLFHLYQAEIRYSQLLRRQCPGLSEVHIPRDYIAIITIAYSWDLQTWLRAVNTKLRSLWRRRPTGSRAAGGDPATAVNAVSNGEAVRVLCLLARNRMQQIHQIDYGASLGFAGGVEEFATAVATDRYHPAMGTIDNEITDFRQVHPVSRLESVNRKGVIALLFTRHRRSQVTTKDLNIDHFRHVSLLRESELRVLCWEGP